MLLVAHYKIDRLADWCAEAGLHVILDMHQDLYSACFGGDGAPDWAVMDKNIPFTYQEPWEKNYIHPAVKESIDSFWKPGKGHPELQTHHIDAMLYLLSGLASHPTVIGLDLYNEPVMPTLTGLINFERRHLSSFLQRAIHSIRKEFPDLWLFFEPSALGANQGMGSWLRKMKDPRAGESRLVYFPHLYTLDLDLTGKYAGWPVLLNFWAKKRKQEARRFKAPLMVGEYGLDESKPGAFSFLNAANAMFDRISSGSFYWAYDECDSGWGLIDQEGHEQSKASVLKRPYLRYIAGRQPRYQWQQDKKCFNCSWINRGDNRVTEIYLPRDCWPDNWSVTCSPEGVDKHFDSDRNLLTVRSSEQVRICVSVSGDKD